MADTALELGEVDPPKWRVLVHGTTYGPYTLGQMQSFVRHYCSYLSPLGL